MAGLGWLVPGADLRAPAAQANVRGVLYAATRRDRNGRYSAAIMDATGSDLNAVALPARGHDAVFCPVTRRCVVFARRPGNFAIAFSSRRETPPVAFTTPPDRHFYGHGVFSRDGKLLFATENDFEAGGGMIGIYDAEGAFRRIGEFASHGIGPHDMALMQGGGVLVVANGGLKEHPDIGGGRRVLKPEAVETSLVYIDVASGQLLERHDLPAASRLSLRHLDVDEKGTVVIGAQAQGRAGTSASMVFRHRRQSDVQSLQLSETDNRELRGYVSSVAMTRNGQHAAITSSKGGVALIVEVTSGRVIDTYRRPDISGVAQAPLQRDGFVFTTGGGDFGTRTSTESSVHPHGAEWDNHLAAG